LRLLERGPERTLFRGREQMLLRAQAQEPLRQQERRLLRHEDRVQVRAQVRCRNLVLLGFEYRRRVRGPSMGPERWLLQSPERLPFPAPYRRLLRVLGRGSFKGQALAQLSGRRLRRRSDRTISDE
jgi:hypothetical protein